MDRFNLSKSPVFGGNGGLGNNSQSLHNERINQVEQKREAIVKNTIEEIANKFSLLNKAFSNLYCEELEIRNQVKAINGELRNVVDKLERKNKDLRDIFTKSLGD